MTRRCRSLLWGTVRGHRRGHCKEVSGLLEDCEHALEASDETGRSHGGCAIQNASKYLAWMFGTWLFEDVVFEYSFWTDICLLDTRWLEQVSNSPAALEGVASESRGVSCPAQKH